MRISILLAGSIGLCSAAASAAPPTADPGSYYFFGDSDLEQGNYQLLAGQTAADHSPYYCADGLCRDSNGPVWPELLGRKVDPVFAATPDAQGLNFAVSGAHMTSRGDPDLAAPSGVETQIERLGAVAASGDIHVGSRDIFFIHAGTNDLLRLLDGEDEAIVRTDIVAAAGRNVAALARQGARTIVIAEIQPVQYLPLLAGADKDGLRSAIGGFIDGTNADLTENLAKLRSELPAGTNLVIFKQKDFLAALRRDYARLGFVAPDTACYDPATGSLCSGDPAVQNRYPFFDPNHFSAAGHALLAAWYRATLDGASGEAARPVGRLPDSLLFESDYLRSLTAATRVAGDDGTRRVQLFGAPFAVQARLDGAGAGPNTALRLRGGLIGIGLPLGASGFGGIAGSWTSGRGRFDNGDGFRTKGARVTGFAGFEFGAARLTASLGYGWPRIDDIRRSTGISDIVADGRANGRQIETSIEIATQHDIGPVHLRSSGSIAYAHVRIGGFEERHADGLALHYGAQNVDRLTFDTDLQASVGAISGAGGFSVRPYVHLASRAKLLGGSHDVRSQLIDNLATPAITRMTSDLETEFDGGGGLEFGLGTGRTVGIAYDRTLLGPDRRTGAWSLRLALRF